MIRRTEDFTSLSNKDFSKIANVINKNENKKLYNSYDSKEKAHVVAAELKIKGFQTEVYRVGDQFQVHSTSPESISLEKAEESGQFKKLAWGRYCFQRESGIGMFDFNYNDGSIWKISQDENGNNVLVKEVDDEDEDSVVRAPSLNNLKTASSSKLSIVSEKTFGKVASMFYGQQDENWIQLILSTDSRHSIIGKLNEKFESVVNEKLAECQISDSNEQDDVKNLIATALENEINSVESLNNFLKNYIQDKINKAGQQRKYFS